MSKFGGMKNPKAPSTGGDGGFGRDKAIGEDFGRYDRDPDSWLRGYVGGEIPGGENRFGDCDDWDGDEGECCTYTDGDADGFTPADRRRGYKVVS